MTELRGRLTPVLAAGGLAATLLTPLAFRGGHPAGVVEVACAVLGLIGIAVEIIAALYILAPRTLAFGISASAAMAHMGRRRIDDAQGFYIALAAGLDRRRIANEPVIDRLRAAFTVMMCGMLFEVCGLASAAAVA